MLWNSLKILKRAICKEYGLFNIPVPACFLATIKLLQVIVQMFLQWETIYFLTNTF